MFEKYVFENLVPRYFSKEMYSQPHSCEAVLHQHGNLVNIKLTLFAEIFLL